MTLGGMAIMDEGGFVASGGPYQIAHPVPEGFWLLPVAFIGVWVSSAAHGIFASRIRGFGLIYATWCAIWTSIGGTTLWYGVNPPSGHGLAWGWLIMGGVFLLVGLGSAWLYASYLRSPDREPSEMPENRRIRMRPECGARGRRSRCGLQIFSRSSGSRTPGVCASAAAFCALDKSSAPGRQLDALVGQRSARVSRSARHPVA